MNPARCHSRRLAGSVIVSFTSRGVEKQIANININDKFISLFAYNRWADRHVLDACRKLTAEQYIAEPAPGWSSVRSTIVHIAVVTDGWLSGLVGESDREVLTKADLPTVDDAERFLDQAHQIFDKLAVNMTPEWLSTPRTLRRGKLSAVLPPWVVLRHVVNHFLEVDDSSNALTRSR